MGSIRALKVRFEVVETEVTIRWQRHRTDAGAAGGGGRPAVAACGIVRALAHEWGSPMTSWGAPCGPRLVTESPAAPPEA